MVPWVLAKLSPRFTKFKPPPGTTLDILLTQQTIGCNHYVSIFINTGDGFHVTRELLFHFFLLLRYLPVGIQHCSAILQAA